MDFVHVLYARETGRSKYKVYTYMCSYCSFIFKHIIYDRVLSAGITNSYDLAIKRLKCYDCDEFCGIYPYNYGQSYNSESPVFACQFCCKANYRHLLALANEDGMIAIQDTRLKSKRHRSGEINAEGKAVLIIRICIPVVHEIPRCSWLYYIAN